MTKNLTFAAIVCTLIAGMGRFTAAQSTASRAVVVGEVTSINLNSRLAVIRTDTGQFVTLSFTENARILKVPAGDTSLTRVSESALAGINVGDRISTRGRFSPDTRSLAAEVVFVMTRTDIQKKQEQETREWAVRGIAGVVRELRPKSAEIALEAYGPAGKARIIVQTTGCRFRRYSPQSVRFSDARPGAFSDIKVGDQLRALGEKSADSLAWKASDIVSGSFQTFGGTVTSIDEAKGEIKISLLGQKGEAFVAITRDSTLKRISPQAALIIAQTLGVRQGNQAATQGQKPGTAAGQKAPSTVSGQAVQLPDPQQIIEALPSIAVSGIKPGDVIAVTSAAGDGSRVTAIKLVAGVDAVINAINARAGQRQMIALSAGLPLGIFDYGISQQ